MAELDLILSENNGSRFIRADLHIHSYGDNGSYDVTDTSMTPENIVDIAVKHGLEVISITDHDSIGNVKRAIDYSAGRVLVIPGIELSTSQGHLLVYFSEYDSLRKFYGKLDFRVDDKSGGGRQVCAHTIPQCLACAKEYGGVGIASHIDSESGFEIEITGYNTFKEDIILAENLLALEIKNKESIRLYSNSDENTDRVQMYEKRRNRISEDSSYELAKVMFSDAHTLESFENNATKDKKTTKFKMDTLEFESFKIALLDSTARVRIEELLPKSFPRFIGIKIDGGLMDGQVVHFSNNLTCIIGGRGTGKSTMLESLRATSGNKVNEKLLDCEIWPDKITLVYRDEVGKDTILTRRKSSDVVNESDGESGIIHIPIESFGQGETADAIQHCGKNPGILLSFIDDFINFEDLKQQEATIRDELIDNQTCLERLAIDIKSIPDIRKAKLNAEKQLATLKEQKAKEVVELEEGLVKERTFRRNLEKNLKEFADTINRNISDKTIINHVLGLDTSKLVVGKNEYDEIRKYVESFSKNIDLIASDMNKTIKCIYSEISVHLKSWEVKENDVNKQIDEIRNKLKEENINLDMAFIKKVTKDVDEYTQKLTELEKKEKEFAQKKKERFELLKSRFAIKEQIFYKRLAFSELLNEELKKTVFDLTVTLKFRQGLYSPKLQEEIKNIMGWRTTQVSKAELIARQIPLCELLDSIRKKNPAALMSVKDKNSNQIFSETESRSIIEIFSSMDHIFNLERCEFEDLPEIKVSKIVPVPSERPKVLVRDFSQLSLGQQQSILLTILLYSKSNKPLIIDQPEDNLDSEFIYKTLVRNLRRVKERRQVIIVTHNPNIAVLGDAELIIPLKSSSIKTNIVDRGSIDSCNTRDTTCNILEGTKQAFVRRKHIYGI